MKTDLIQEMTSPGILELLDLNAIEFVSEELYPLKKGDNPINVNSGDPSLTHLSYQDGEINLMKFKTLTGFRYVMVTEDDVFIYPEGITVHELIELTMDNIWEFDPEFEEEGEDESM